MKTVSMLWVHSNRGSSSVLHLKTKGKEKIYPNFPIFPFRFVGEKQAAHINLEVPALRPSLTNIRLKESIPMLERNPTQSQFPPYSCGPLSGRRAANGLTRGDWILGYVLMEECVLPDGFRQKVKCFWLNALTQGQQCLSPSMLQAPHLQGMQGTPFQGLQCKVFVLVLLGLLRAPQLHTWLWHPALRSHVMTREALSQILRHPANQDILK